MMLTYEYDTYASQFTSKERDAETGLDYFGARYNSGAQGRFLCPDSPFADQHIQAPQSWNLYTYARNIPLLFVDPTGRTIDYADDDSERLFNQYEKYINGNPKKYKKEIATIRKLRDSKVNYRINVTDKISGKAETEGKTVPDQQGNILVSIRNIGGPQGEKMGINGRFAHELEHGRQFDSGELTFVKVSGDSEWQPFFRHYDIMDEVNAFQSQLNVSWPVLDDARLHALRGLSSDAMANHLLSHGYDYLKRTPRGSRWIPSPELGLKPGQPYQTDTFYGVAPE